ncbi:MAG TPA: DUF1844 domain-containing protein [Terriglobales bacterium]
MPEKKPEFVVTDRRKFTEEGDLRPDVQGEERTTSPGPATSISTSTEPQAEQESFTPPTAAEQDAQKDAYHASGLQIDEALGQHGKVDPKDFEMTFERLIGSLYMTALIQLGAVQEEGKPVQPDIIGARQTIDTISLLSDKTKGNLTQKEQSMLQNALFELRMAFVEVTNSITRAPQGPNPTGGRSKN